MYESKDKMEISVITIPGTTGRLEDNFFINGRTREWLDSSIVNFVVENPVSDGIFSVTSNMDHTAKDGGPSISFVKELKRFQTRTSSSGGDLESKTNMLREQIAEVNNFIHSVELSVPAQNEVVEQPNSPFDDESERENESENEIKSEVIEENIKEKRSVACIYVENGKYTMLTSGNAKVFSYSNGVAKQLTHANLRVDRLVKLGVMSESQARDISSAENDGVSQFPKATLNSGDSLVLCTGASTGFVDEQTLSVILASTSNLSTKGSDILIGPAGLEIEHDLSVMIINIGGISSFSEFVGDEDEETEMGATTKIAIVFAIILALVVGLTGGYMLLPGMFGKKLVAVSTAKPTKAASKANDTSSPNATVAPTNEPQSTIEPTTPPSQGGNGATLNTAGLTKNAEGKWEYTVKDKDTFWDLSIKFYGKFKQDNLDSLQAANPGMKLNPGKTIIVPEL